ncbi:hypothetical protein BJ742DRAFT_407856 [Cladochytrium replicatum]|nr:hypothetical protein BJ742DRAFT_407856 [Cladochytrium replicatum]
MKPSGQSRQWYMLKYDPARAGNINGTPPAQNVVHDSALARVFELQKFRERRSARRKSNSQRTVGQHEEQRSQTTDRFSTLFVGRIDFSTTEETLRNAANVYGQLRSVHLVRHPVTGDSRGYAFIEYERQSDCERAYRMLNQQMIDGRAVLCDYERGRVMQGWVPRRRGGGLGGKIGSGQMRFGGREKGFKGGDERAGDTNPEGWRRVAVERMNNERRKASSTTFRDNPDLTYKRLDKGDERRGRYRNLEERRYGDRGRKDQDQDAGGLNLPSKRTSQQYSERSHRNYESSAKERDTRRLREQQGDRLYERDNEYDELTLRRSTKGPTRNDEKRERGRSRGNEERQKPRREVDRGKHGKRHRTDSSRSTSTSVTSRGSSRSESRDRAHRSHKKSKR